MIAEAIRRPLLEVHGLHAYYGRAHVLHGVSLDVARGEVLALMGRNGAGKSTTLKAIMGLVRPSTGMVRLRGSRIEGLEPYEIARLRVGYVAEDRRVFADLTVAENLETGRRPAPGGWTAWDRQRLCALFPNLADLFDRRAGETSGGEQQMLAIARTLMGNPELLLLDEPSEGLAPVIVALLAKAIHQLKVQGLAIVLAEQNLRLARGVSDRVAVLQTGQVAFSGEMTTLVRDLDRQRELLGVDSGLRVPARRHAREQAAAEARSEVPGEPRRPAPSRRRPRG